MQKLLPAPKTFEDFIDCVMKILATELQIPLHILKGEYEKENQSKS